MYHDDPSLDWLEIERTAEAIRMTSRVGMMEAASRAERLDRLPPLMERLQAVYARLRARNRV